MSNNATCSTLYNNFKNIFQIVTPGPRNQIISPYTNSTLDVSGTRNTITQEDLNMRRKVEILQYNKNGSNNAKVSKKQNYSRIAKSVKNYTATAQTCSTTYNLPTPTYASDVPGPLQYLTYKPEVPLYMYAMNTAAFNENETENTLFFNDIKQEYKCSNNVLTKAFSMANMNSKNISEYLNLSIPIGLYVTGTCITGAQLEGLRITGFDLIIRKKEDNSLVNFTYESDFELMKNNGIIIDTNSNQTFLAQQMIGVLNIANIDIDINIFSIYDFYFQFSIDSSFNGNYHDIDVGTVVNILGNGYNNCQKYFYVELPIYTKFIHSFSINKTDIVIQDLANIFRIDIDGTEVDIMQQISYVPLQNLYKGEYLYGTTTSIYYVNNYYCIEKNGVVTFFKLRFKI